MAIQYVGASVANGTSVSMPSHQAGDLIIIAAYRHDSNLQATRPSGWYFANGSGGSTNSLIVCWKRANSNSETSGTWTNATQVGVWIARSNTSKVLNVNNTTATSGTTSPINYNLSSFWSESAMETWVMAFCGSRTDAAAETPPTGMVNRASNVSTGELAIHDTNGDVPSWSLQSVTTSTVTWRTVLVEVSEDNFTIPSGGSASARIVNVRGGADQ